MNDTALRGLLSVSFLMWLAVGIRGEDLHVFAVEAGEGDESVLAAERRHRCPTRRPMTITQIPASKLAIRTTGPP